MEPSRIKLLGKRPRIFKDVPGALQRLITTRCLHGLPYALLNLLKNCRKGVSSEQELFVCDILLRFAEAFYNDQLPSEREYERFTGIDGKVVLWDIAEGTAIADFNGHSDAVYSLCFSREGHVLASGGNDNAVKLWDVKRAYGVDDDEDFGLTKLSKSGSSVSTFETASFLTKACRVQTVHFTRRNLLLASGSFLSPQER